MNRFTVGRTLILIKPDAIGLGLSGEIIKRFERKGFRIIKAEMQMVEQEKAKVHYSEHATNREYYEKMCNHITCGPVIAMILEGVGVVEGTRQLIGTADPMSSAPGTIRRDFARADTSTLVHGSDSDRAAAREIALWFGEEYVINQRRRPSNAYPVINSEAYNSLNIAKKMEAYEKSHAAAMKKKKVIGKV